ncbi:MAG: sigma 54-interacting transcriptional regulator [Planctomycetota bacterium]
MDDTALTKNDSSSTFSRIYRDFQVTFELLRSQTKSKEMLEALALLEQCKDYSEPLLLIGETGVGKNMIAQAFHNAKNTKGNFYELNCAGLTETLIESELFGHKKGAFASAYFNKTGLVEMASKGTLFLDEIGEIPLTSQIKLLRFLETRQFIRVGDTEIKEVDCSVLCATNKSLETLRNPANFRQDLFYRIYPYIVIPSLRVRGKEDIAYLIQEYINRYSKGQKVIFENQSVIEKLLAYSWPGNIRELAKVMKFAVYRSLAKNHFFIKESYLPEEIIYEEYTLDSTSYPDKTLPSENIKEMQRKKIISILEKHQGKKNLREIIATETGLSPSTVWRRLKEYRENGYLEEDQVLF